MNEELKNPISSEINEGFKIKMVNKATAYPPMNETDLLKVKVGDYMEKKYGAYGTIYQVVSIDRGGVTDMIMNHWEKQRGNSLFVKLTAEYKKNLNFGSCIINLKCILRGGKSVNKGKLVQINEMSEYLSYRGYALCNIPNSINNMRYVVNRDKYRLQKVSTKIANAEQVISSLENLIKPKVEVNDEPKSK